MLQYRCRDKSDARNFVRFEENNLHLCRVPFGKFTPSKDDALVSFILKESDAIEGDTSQPSLAPHQESAGSKSAITQLKKFMKVPRKERQPFADQEFVNAALTSKDAKLARELLATDHVEHIRQEREEEMESGVLKHDGHEMPFFFKRFSRALCSVTLSASLEPCFRRVVVTISENVELGEAIGLLLHKWGAY